MLSIYIPLFMKGR